MTVPSTIILFGMAYFTMAVHAFVPIATAPTHNTAYVTSSATGAITTTSLSMGIFDGIKKAFDNEEFEAPPEGIKATARHILLKSNDDAAMVKDQIDDGAKFADMAREYSTCPSSAQGGSLGSFSPGTMVPEFDKVIFDPDTPLEQVVGPVVTDVSWHLILLCREIVCVVMFIGNSLLLQL